VHDTALFEGPGVVIGRKGMGHLGVEWVYGDYWVIDTAYSLEPLGDSDLKFAYYLIRHVGVDHLKHGTSNPSLTREAFAAQLFPVPPIEEQRAIAEVLGALDDKIAANDRQIKLVQELADAIFARFAKDVPDGGSTFAEVADVGGGETPRTSVGEYWGGSIPWATPTDVTGLAAPYLSGTSRMITDAGLAASDLLK
ncbi:MAG: restriction endonuclease subunit S, partial [Nocardioidaceae bacterium]